jgi:hypothetical protein
VTFSVSSVDGLQTGDQIANGASIVFDRNEPIITPTFVNSIDTSPPKSAIKAAKATRGTCRDLKVKFGGKDKGSGIAMRNVYVSRNGGRYAPWRLRTKRKSDRYRAVAAGAYVFHSTATDGVGNPEVVNGAIWDTLVKSARKRGDRLVLKLDRKAAKDLRVRKLRLTVNGKRKLALNRVPGKVGLGGLRIGGSKIGLEARMKGNTKLRETRMVAICPRAPKRR